MAKPSEYEWGPWERSRPGDVVDGYFVRVRPQGNPADDVDGSVVIVDFQVRSWDTASFDGPDLETYELEGTIKWDGCSNFHSDPRCMVHICGPYGIDQLAEALRLAFRMAAQVLTTCDYKD